MTPVTLPVMTSTPSLTSRLSWRAPFVACAILASALTAHAYSPQVVLTPREGQGNGTLSAYAGFTPVFEPNAAGDDAVKLPAPTVKELSLVWTFWGHTQPSANEWPTADGLSVFTLTSTADATLRLRATYRAEGEWSPVTELPEVNVKAGEPAKVELPLAPHTSLNKIDCIRIIFNSPKTIPELSITDWSVGGK